MQIVISQSRQFKYSIVYVVKVAFSYNCSPTIMQHFVVKKCFYFKTPDGAASISSPSYWQQYFSPLLLYVIFVHGSNISFLSIS